MEQSFLVLFVDFIANALGGPRIFHKIHKQQALNSNIFHKTVESEFRSLTSPFFCFIMKTDNKAG